MISWVKDRSTLRLDIKPFILMKHDNFGMMPYSRIEDSAPLQHGATDRGFKLPPRNLTMYIELFADNWEQYYQLRDQLLRSFSPSGEAGYLLVEEGGFARLIYGYPVDGLGFADADRNFQRHIVPITIHCPDPLWVSQQIFSQTIEGGGSLDVGAVPTTVPFTVGTSVMSQTGTIAYGGSFETYPEVILISGAITDAKITNNLTGAVLDFTGTTIGAGSSYKIELGYGKFRIFDNNGVNRIDKLSASSDMTGFKLKTIGQNTLTVTGSSITGSTNVMIAWYERYIGI